MNNFHVRIGVRHPVFFIGKFNYDPSSTCEKRLFLLERQPHKVSNNFFNHLVKKILHKNASEN